MYWCHFIKKKKKEQTHDETKHNSEQVLRSNMQMKRRSDNANEDVHEPTEKIFV